MGAKANAVLGYASGMGQAEDGCLEGALGLSESTGGAELCTLLG